MRQAKIGAADVDDAQLERLVDVRLEDARRGDEGVTGLGAQLARRHDLRVELGDVPGDPGRAEVRGERLVHDPSAVRVGEVGGRREIAQVAGGRRRQPDLVGDDELGDLVLPHRHARRRVHAEHAGVLQRMPQPARQLRPLRLHEPERVRVVADRIEACLVRVRRRRSPQERGADVVDRERADRCGDVERQGDTDARLLDARGIDGHDVGATARECALEDDDRWVCSMPGRDQDHSTSPFLRRGRVPPARRRRHPATTRSGRRRRTRSRWCRHDAS